MKYLATAVSAAVALLVFDTAGATDFKDFVPALSTATTPYGATDYFPLVQGGATTKVPGNAFVAVSDLGTDVQTFLGSPVGNILATWLASGSAVANLGFTPVTNARTITAGTGLSGGGDLTANRTLSLAAGAAATNLGFTPVTDARTVTGTGMLAGGGDLTANRTITLGATAANTVVMNATGSSAVPTAVAVPACADSGGHHLNYASGAWSCGTSSSGGIDLSAVTDGSIIYDDAGALNEVTLGSGLAMTSGTLALSEVVNTDSTTSRTIIAGDANETVRLTNAGSITVPLTAAATLGTGFGVYIECGGTSCTVDPDSSETIDGASTLVLAQHQKAWISSDGTGWRGAVAPYRDQSNAANMVSGTLAVARGGTGITSLGTGVATFLGTPSSANLASAVTNETGSSLLVFNTSPSLVTPDLGVPSAVDLTNASNIPNVTLPIGWVAGVNPTLAVIFTASRAMTVTDIRGTVATATGGTSTVAVYKAPSGTACGSGTIQHSGTFNANGTAATNQTLTLVGGSGNNLAIGDRLCLVTTGTTEWTSGTGNGGITVTAKAL
jgi:hypothetical protein